MKTIRLLPLAAAAVSLAASAQTARPVPAVADPAAPVAPISYQSVFPVSGTQTEHQPSPDLQWGAANRQVATPVAAGHGGHGAHAGHGQHAAPAPVAPQMPAPSPGKPGATKHDGHHPPSKEK